MGEGVTVASQEEEEIFPFVDIIQLLSQERKNGDVQSFEKFNVLKKGLGILKARMIRHYES